MIKELFHQLREADVGIVLENEQLSNHTTWRIGGPADLLVQPKDKNGLAQAMKLVYEHRVPWFAIGRGSNLLVRDGGIRGVVFKVAAEGLSHLAFNDTRVQVGAGYPFIRLAVLAAKEGLTGLEFAGGIPGSVGGAVFMNAGAHGSDVSRIFSHAEILDEKGVLRSHSREDLQFQYRTSSLQSGMRGIVTEVTFQLAHGDRKQIAAAMASHKDRRRQTQPLQLPCAGSVFRNPDKDHAGRLIEAAELKGFRVGDAQVSEIHGNFIVNLDRATAHDVLTLIGHIQRIVKEKFGVDLVPEVRVVGEG